MIAGMSALVMAGYVVAAYKNFSAVESDPEVTSSIRPANIKPSPKGASTNRTGTYRVGDPYVIAGRTYVPREDPTYRAEGVASWYGESFHGRLTANGETYDMYALSAAHPTLPLPSYARVTNLENNVSLIVRLNDRGPFHDDRLIDLSVKAAQLLGFHARGLTRVRVEYIGPAELNGSDNEKLTATLRREEPIEIETVGTTSRTVPLARKLASRAQFPSVDAFGADQGDLQLSAAQSRDPLDEAFPKAIFD